MALHRRVLAWIAVGACAVESDTGAPAGVDSDCTPVAAPTCPVDPPRAVDVGVVAEPEIDEASGLAWDGRWLWTHNDSGGGPVLFALDPRNAQTVGRVRLEGVAAIDWEDMAADRAATLPVLWIGDVGDNAAARVTVSLHRVTLAPGDIPAVTSVETFTLSYDDGVGHDVEALWVDDGVPWVATKREDPVLVFAADLGPEPRFVRRASVAAAVVGGPWVTGGDAADGWLVLRSLDAAYAFPRRPGEPVGEALARTPCIVPLAREPQGEAIAVAPDALWTLSEGRDMPLRRYAWDGAAPLLPQDACVAR